MKSNKEMIEDVFSRIEEEKMKERKKHQNRVYMVSMSGIGLAMLIGIGAWLGVEIKNGEIGSLQSGGTQNDGKEDAIGKSTESENASVAYELLARIEQAVWAREKHHNGKFEEVEPVRTEYTNGFDCDRELYDYLTKSPEKIYAIVAVPKESDKYKEATQSIKEQLDAQDISNFVYMNRTNGQFNCYFLVTAIEFKGIQLENAQDYWFNHALKPTNIEQILFPEIYDN